MSEDEFDDAYTTEVEAEMDRVWAELSPARQEERETIAHHPPPQTQSSSPTIYGRTRSRVSESPVFARDLEELVGQPDTSYLRILNLVTPGLSASLLNYARLLTQSTTSHESATRMEDIISTLFSTSHGSSKPKMFTDSALDEPDLVPLGRALARLTATYFQCLEHPSTPGTMSRNMVTSLRVISTDHLLGGLTQLVTICGPEVWHLQLKQSFLRTLASTVREISAFTPGRSSSLQRTSMARTGPNQTSPTWRRGGSRSTGTDTHQSESGSSEASPTPSKRSSPLVEDPHTPKRSCKRTKQR